MATPAKAFTDPSGVPARLMDYRALPSFSSIGAPLGPIGGTLRAWELVPWRKFFTSVGRMPNALENNVKSKIPPPPLGRLLFATFPSIYKERPSETTVLTRSYPLVGQIFPDPMSALPLFADDPLAGTAGQFWP